MVFKNVALSALIEGFKDGGNTFVSNFPGFHSQYIYNALGGKRISLNERIAFETAYGASLGGKRSVVTMKGVGLNSCADPFLHAHIAGVHAGLVVVVGDDVEVSYSPVRQDSRHYREFFGGLWLEPVTVQMAYDMAYNSLEWSEKLDIPIVIRYTNQFLTLKGNYVKKEAREVSQKICSNRKKYISSWAVRGPRLYKKQQDIQKFVDKNCKPLRVNSSKFRQESCLVFGNCTTELHKANSAQKSQLIFYSYPFPEKDIKKFSKIHPKITVYEQGCPYAFEKVQNILSHNLKINKPSLSSNTGNVPNPDSSWITFSHLSKLFNALKLVSPSFVMGDEGQYTDESTQTIQCCLCMGASLGIGLGLALSGAHYPFSITGDAAFAFAGMQTLSEIQSRNVKMGIVVIDNGGAQSTGGQKVITDIYNIDSNINQYFINYQNTSKKKMLSVLKQMKSADKLAVLFVQI